MFMFYREDYLGVRFIYNYHYIILGGACLICVSLNKMRVSMPPDFPIAWLLCGIRSLDNV